MLKRLTSNVRAVFLFVSLVAVLLVPVVGTLAVPADPTCNPNMVAYPLSKDSNCNGTFSPNGDGRKDTAFFHVTGTSPGVSAHIVVYDPTAPTEVYARIKLVETGTGTYDSDWNKDVSADDANENLIIEGGETGWDGSSTTGKVAPLADGMKFVVAVCGAAWATLDPPSDYRCVDSASDALIPGVESVSGGIASYVSIDNLEPINGTFEFSPNPTSTDVSVAIGYNEPVSYVISSPADTWLPYPPVPASEDPRITVTQQINGSASIVIDNDTFIDQEVAAPYDGNIISRGGPAPATNGPVSNDISFVPGVADGLASVDIRGVDYAGNIALDSTTVLVDTIAPTATITGSPSFSSGATFDYVGTNVNISGLIDDNPEGANAPNDEVVGLDNVIYIEVSKYNSGTASFDTPVGTIFTPVDFSEARTSVVNGSYSTGTLDVAGAFGASCGDIFRFTVLERDLLGNADTGPSIDLAYDPTPPDITGLVADAVSSQNSTSVHFEVNVTDPLCSDNRSGVDMGSVNLYTTVPGFEGPIPMSPMQSVDSQGNGSYEANFAFTDAADSVSLEDATVDASDNVANYAATPFVDVFDIDSSAPDFADPLNLHSNATNSGNWASPDINIYYFTDEVPGGADQALTSWSWTLADMSVQVDDIGLEGVLDVTIDLNQWGGSSTEPMVDEVTADTDWNHDGDSADANVYGTQQLTGGNGLTFSCGLNTATITARDNANGANTSTYQTQFLYDCGFPGGSVAGISGDLNTYDDGSFVWIGAGTLTSVDFNGTVSDEDDPQNSGINTVNAYVLVNNTVVDTQLDIALSNQTYQATRDINGGEQVYPDVTESPNGEVLTGDWSINTSALGAYASCAGCVVTVQIEAVDNAGLVQWFEQEYVINNTAPSVTNGMHLLDGDNQPADYGQLDTDIYNSDSDNASTDVWYSASTDTLYVAITAGPDGIVDTAAVGDDIQIFAPAATPGANEVAIAAGPNGYTDTLPANDDVEIRVPLMDVELNAPASWGYPAQGMTDEDSSGTDWNQNGPLQPEVWGVEVAIPHGMPAVTPTGTYSASVEATDALGNEALFDPITLDVDNEDPTISEPMVLQRDDTEDYYISDQSGSTSSPHDTNAYLSVRVNDPTVSGISSGVLEVSIGIPAADFDGTVAPTDEITLDTDLDRDGDTDADTYRLVDEVTADTDWNESGGQESDVYGIEIDADGMALDGLKDFVVTATDKAQYPDGTKGNNRDDNNGGAWIEMIIDSTAPDASLVRPADTEWINTYNPTATFSGLVSDDATGILDSGMRTLEIFFDDGDGPTSLGFATLNVTATQDQRNVFGSNDPILGPVVDITYPDDVLGAAEAIQAEWSITTSALFGLPCSGAIDMTAEAVDNAGHLETFSLGNIKLECTQPGLSVGSPENHSYVSTVNTGNMATIDGYANDTLSGVYQVQYSLDSGISWTDVTSSPYPTHPSSVYWYLNWDTTGLPDGTNNFLFRSIDWAQNEQLAGGYVSWTVKLDNTSPSSKISAPLNNTYTSADEVSVAGTAKDTSGSGIDKVEILVDETPIDVDGGTSNWVYMLDTTLLSEGEHTLESRATDIAGNVETDGVVKKIYVDNGAPVISSLVASPSPIGLGVEAITFDVTDAVDSTLTVAVTSNGTTLNCTASESTYTCEQNINAGSVNGIYDVVVTATDRSGNSSKATTSFMVDTTAPMATLMIDQNRPFTNSITRDVTVNIQDGDSGASEMRFKNEDGVWSDWFEFATSDAWELTDGDGTKTVFVQVRDAAGNMSTEASDTIILDTTAPAVNITTPVDNSSTNANSIVIGGNADDTGGSGIMKVLVAVGAEAPYEEATGHNSWSSIWTTIDGDHTIKAIAIDNAGNVSSEYEVDVTVDTTAPSFEIVPSPATTGVGEVSIAVTPNELVTATPDVSVNGQPAVCGSVLISTYTCTYNVTTGTGTGTATIIATGTDYAGNTGSSSASMTVDVTAPEGLISVDSDATYANSTQVELSLSASDVGTGVSLMRFRNETGAWSSYDSFEGSTSWDLTAGDGVKTVFAQYKDAAGNESAVVSDTIMLDQTVPTEAITYPVDEANVMVSGAGSEVAIYGTAQDVTSGIESVHISICNIDTEQCDDGDAVGDNSWSYTWEVPAEGEYDITVSATDKAGNTTNSDTSFTVNFDGTAPSFASINVDPFYVNMTTTSITFTADEELSADPTVLVNGQPAQKVGGPNYNSGTELYEYEYSYSVNTYSGEGPAILSITGTDLSGITGSASSQFVIDLTAPSGTFDSPGHLGDVGGDPVTLSGTASDIYYSGIGRVDVSIDGGDWATADGTENWSYDWDDPNVGDHSLDVRVTDRAGNETLYATGFHVTFVPVEDHELDRIVYSGTWEEFLDVRASEGSVVVLEGKNSLAAMNFYGKKIEFVTAKAKMLGKVDIYIDGDKKTVVNLYSATVKAQQTVFTYSFPTYGNHQIAVVATGTKDPKATDSLVPVDKFVIR